MGVEFDSCLNIATVLRNRRLCQHESSIVWVQPGGRLQVGNRLTVCFAGAMDPRAKLVSMRIVWLHRQRPVQVSQCEIQLAKF